MTTQPHLVYPRIELHRNVLGQQWASYLTGHSQQDHQFSGDPLGDEIRSLLASESDDPEFEERELAGVPIYDLRNGTFKD